MIRISVQAASARRMGLLATSFLAFGSTAAQAQETDRVVIGIGGAATPAYQGSEDHRVIPIPAIDIKEGWFFANLRDGIGIEPIDTKTVTVGASAVFVQGIRRRDLPEGLDKRSDAVGARVFTRLRTGGFAATFGATKVLGGTKGVIADASVSYPIEISSRFVLTPTIGTTWADRKYNDGYFGVTTTEALASGLPQFSTGSGFKDISGAVTASYRLTDRFTLSATAGVTSLLGDIKDSPLVEKKTQPLGVVTVTYRM